MAEGELTLAKKVHIYSNGDRFFTGRRFVINPRQTRNYDSFLTQVTHSLKPAFGAVRVLRTPENGHAVGDLEDLETGRSYVACAQKFVKLGYEDITTKPKPAPSPERRNKVVASGRIKKIERTPIAVFVYTNGQPLEQAKRILLKPWVNKTWETVLVAINEKINLVTGAVRQIYDMATKEEVTEGVHLKNNEYYIAVGSERFKDLEYGSQPAILSPRQQQKRRYPTLRPVKKKKSNDSQGSSPLESSTNSTQSISKRSDEAPAKARRRAPQNTTNTEEGIPIKPIKHKRGSSDKVKEPAGSEPKDKPVEKKNPPQHAAGTKPAVKKANSKSTVDLDKDEGGVFKAKGRKQKVNEVREDRNVKEEVPIDKRKAEIVEDEQPISFKNKEPLPPVQKNKGKPETQKEAQKKSPAKKQPQQLAANKSQNSNKTKSASKEEKEKAAIKIQAQYRGYRTRKHLKKQKQERKSSAQEEPSNESRRQQAAVTIQKNYRGYKTRKDLKKKKESTSQNEEKERNDKEQPEDANAAREKAAIVIQANYRGYRVRKELKKNKKEKKDAVDDSASKREAAATTIQAGYRGYRARKEVKALREQRKNEKAKETEARAQSRQSKTDAEQENAAVRIQANFRGYKTRKHVNAKG